MPKLQTLANDEKIYGGSIKFSAAKPESLQDTEYSLVTIVVDATGSVSPFEHEIISTLKNIIHAANMAPQLRAENMLVRVLKFNSYAGVEEIHGFRLLDTIDVDEYQTLNPTGMTNLFDVVYDAVDATLQYAETLNANKKRTNGVIHIITDGADNVSRKTPSQIKDRLTEIRSKEILPNFGTYLIGVNVAQASQLLDEFKMNAELTDYVDMGDANPSNIAKITGFVTTSMIQTSVQLSQQI